MDGFHSGLSVKKPVRVFRSYSKAVLFAVNGQLYVTDYKLNGAVTGILKMDPYIAVSTSQGVLHLFRLAKDPRIHKYTCLCFVNSISIELVPWFRRNMRQKITNITTVKSLHDSHTFVIVFLQDGTVGKVKVADANDGHHQTMLTKRIGKLPIPTKMVVLPLDSK